MYEVVNNFQETLKESPALQRFLGLTIVCVMILALVLFVFSNVLSAMTGLTPLYTFIGIMWIVSQAAKVLWGFVERLLERWVSSSL